MPELDETDLEILQLLVADARRPYSEIADRVGVSPPTVSDRIERLEDVGVIRRFTLDIDQGTLDAGIQVLVEVETTPGATADVADDLAARNVVEHVYATADGAVVAHAAVPEEAVGDVLASSVDMEDVQSYDVRLLTDQQWAPTVSGTAFAVDCEVCGDQVTSKGETLRTDSEVFAFCSTECREEFEIEHEALAESA